jgi:transglutaminase-like putative cysteine protease/Tfp pilus assembly protein PilF
VAFTRGLFRGGTSLFLLGLSSLTISQPASDPWNSPPFSLSPETLRQAAAAIKPAKDTDVTVLLAERRFEFDAEGKEVEIYHTIYRIEDEEGVKGWAETSGEWEPWHQAKPEIKARVISPDASVHELDPKTLNDVAVHEDSPDIYTDRRAYGGPLPAVAVGAIIEELLIFRDTAPLFRGGIVDRSVLVEQVPVNKARVVISYPDSIPLRYGLRLLPDAALRESVENGRHLVAIESGPFPPYTEKTPFLPGDAVAYPEVEFATGTSWHSVAEEYARLSKEKFRIADVQALVAKTPIKSASRNEGIRRLLAVLHKSVRYTGVEFGESSLIPQFPAETLKRKYGDCKDKAALLVTMLRAAGVPANLALLDTGPGPDINPDLPGIGLFDHAIVYVPASANDSEMWIDATDEYARAGVLPFMDYGRWALVVDEQTTELKKIPELAASGNLHREKREFTMAEFGPASIKETDEDIGPKESDSRELYDGDAKEAREQTEKYVKRAYLADSLISLDHTNPSDAGQPFSVSFVTKGKRGTTDFESATMAIRVEDLFSGLPQYFTTAADESADKEKKEEDGEEREERHRPRTLDWQLWPFINEWDYRVVAPPGFKLRALPPDRDVQLGTAHFTQKYSSNADGTVVDAVLRFESGKPRLTVSEAKALRDAVVKAENSDPVLITFDQLGHLLLAAGKIKESLAAYHGLVQMHPREALHRIQLARALLQAGLAEKARAIAREAIALDAKSAQAYSTLAWILEHDLLGRRFKKGFELEGAISAYRKARELAPKDTDVRANLGMVLEYDTEGERYGPHSKLKEAIAEFQELKKLDEAAGRGYDDFILYDLWYQKDFAGLIEAASALPASETRRSLIVAAFVVTQGMDAGLKKSLEITSDEASRRKALSTAGRLLVRLGKYPEAAELLAAGARGQADETQTTAFAAHLAKARVRDDIKIDERDPRSAIQLFYSYTFSNAPDYSQLRRLASRNALRSSETKKEREEFSRAMFQLRRQLEREGMTLEIVGDIVLTNMRYSLDGSDEKGYKVTVETPGAAPQEAYIVKEEGRYKILEYPSSQKAPGNLGWQALECLNANDIAGARQWLDWARETTHISGGDDPLAGQVFPYFWTKGQQGDAGAIRVASLSLVSPKELKGDDLTLFLQSKDNLKTDLDRARIDLVVAAAYSAQERWPELASTAESLLKAYPDSLTAFHLATRAYAKTNRFQEWAQLVEERLHTHAAENDYIRSAAELAAYRGDYTRARELLKTLIEKSKATQGDLNSYAWDALFLAAPVAQDSLEAAERANQLSKNSEFSILHTLACIYAEAGKPAQGREVLLKAMEAGSLEEPNSAVWLALGEIAEQYGEVDAARAMYARVEKEQVDYPGSNHALAQQHLQALKNAVSGAAKAGTP